jgi:hypothetical protein
LKNLADEIRAVREAHPGVEVEAWAQDGASDGLQAHPQKGLGPPGRTTACAGSPPLRVALCLGPHPAIRESCRLILPTVNKELFSAELGEFCEWVGAGRDKHVVCWPSIRLAHQQRRATLPEGLCLLMLPTHSP